MKFSVNTMMTRGMNIFSAIETCAKCGFDGLELWLQDVEVAPHEIRSCLQENGLLCSSLEKIEGWYETDGELMGVPDTWEAIQDECRRRINIASLVGAPIIVACPPYSHRGRFGSPDQGQERYAKLLQIGREMGVQVVLEFMGQTVEISTLKDCLDFLDGIESNLQMIVDSYHIWRGGDSMESLAKLPLSRIALAHVSDACLGIKREEHRDRDRVMPGKGQIDLTSFFHLLADYKGFVALGVYNPALWSEPPESMLKEAYRSLSTWK